MANLEWRDRLVKEVKRRNLPDSYAARLIEELTDHFTDIQKENLSMDALDSADHKLGTPEYLATSAVNEFRKRTFTGRHPFLVFALMPIPVSLLIVILNVLTIAYPFEWLSEFCRFEIPIPFGSQSKITLDEVAHSISLHAIRFAPFIIASWLFIRVSLRTNNPTWGMFACILISYFAFIFRAVLEPSWQCLRIGIGYEHGLHQWENGLVQMLIPVLMGIWAWRNHETWGRLCKLSLFLVPLFPIVCAIPLNSRTGKLMATSVLSILMALAFSGVVVCVFNDRFKSRMSRA